MILCRTVALGLLSLAFILGVGLPIAHAQNRAQPAMPETLTNLAAKGAQVRYLGKEKGLDGWIAVFQGQEQYFYVTPDGQAIVMGLLFGADGKMVTVRQIQKLQQGGDPTLDTLVMSSQPAAEADTLKALQDQISRQAKATTSPAENLFADVEKTNWISLGSDAAPVIYAFLDPQCPHCHEFMKDIRKDFIEAGQLQVRLVPVGFQEETKAQSAVLLAAPDAAARWFRHLDGDATALPVSSDVNRQAVELNMSVMQTWKLDATPMIIYRSSKGEVKIIRGRPKNPLEILNDLT